MTTELASSPAPLTAAEIEAFAREWYRLLDEHAPVERVMALIAPGEVEFRLPEATLISADQVRQWYAGGGGFAGVINVFFDEEHTLQSVQAEPAEDRASARVVVSWQARTWRPPSPRSERVAVEADQHWELVRSAGGQPVIVRYLVDALRAGPAVREG